jgi:signal peptidase I
MALVIRQFAIEAFKIPTGSMMPTLYGDSVQPRRSGDRILVDKIGPMVSGLDRFDVIVFKFPLNESRNYIKRVVAFGGETLTIRDGDVWIDGEIARKPPHVQEVLFFEIYPGMGADEAERRRAVRRWQSDPLEGSVERVGEAGFALSAADREQMLVYSDPVMDDCRAWSPRLDAHERVGDVKLTFEVTPRQGGGEVVVRISENGVGNELVLAVGGGVSRVRHGGELERELPGVVLEAGETVEVSFANVDDALRVVVDGEEFELLYPPVEKIDHDRDQIRFGVRNAAAAFEEVRLYRDLHYVRDGSSLENVEIPEGHLFCLGDNTRSSKDSRRWRLDVYQMENGDRFRHDSNDDDPESRVRPGPRPGTIRFQDERGIWVTLDEAEVKARFSEAAPFVPRENVIGRAFFVFWPLNPFNDSFRMKFIR